MRSRRRAFALIVAAALAAVTMTVAVGAVVATFAEAAVTPAVACTYPAWAEGVSYKVGDRVTYLGHAYQALQANTPPVGAGWTPVAVPALWQDLGACTGGTTPASPTPSRTTASPSPTPSRTT